MKPRKCWTHPWCNCSMKCKVSVSYKILVSSHPAKRSNPLGKEYTCLCNGLLPSLINKQSIQDQFSISYSFLWSPYSSINNTNRPQRCGHNIRHYLFFPAPAKLEWVSFYLTLHHGFKLHEPGYRLAGPHLQNMKFASKGLTNLSSNFYGLCPEGIGRHNVKMSVLHSVMSHFLGLWLVKKVIKVNISAALGKQDK